MIKIIEEKIVREINWSGFNPFFLLNFFLDKYISVAMKINIAMAETGNREKSLDFNSCGELKIKKIAGRDAIAAPNMVNSISKRIPLPTVLLSTPSLLNWTPLARNDHIFPGTYLFSSDTEYLYEFSISPTSCPKYLRRTFQATVLKKKNNTKSITESKRSVMLILSKFSETWSKRSKINLPIKNNAAIESGQPMKNFAFSFKLLTNVKQLYRLYGCLTTRFACERLIHWLGLATKPFCSGL